MTWIASWQDHVKHGPAGSEEFGTEDDAQRFANERVRQTGGPCTVWELGDEEGLG